MKKLIQWVEGDVVDVDDGSYTIVRIVTARKGYKTVVASYDGKPVHLGARCTCGGVTNVTPAIDLVTEATFDVCVNCRFRKVNA